MQARRMGDEEHADAGEQVSNLADGTLVQNTNAAMGFPDDSRQADARRHAVPLVDYDLGSHFATRISRGVLTSAPVVEGSCRQLVVRVDADGNEVAGIKSPLLWRRSGPYTGWNVTTSGLFKGQLCGSSFGASPTGIHPVREDEGRAHGERRSAAVARRTIQGSRWLRAGRENRRRQTRAR